MKSLADQIREELGKPKNTAAEVPPKARAPSPGTSKGKKTVKELPQIVRAIIDYDTSPNKKMLHVRFDQNTVDILNRFKIATGTDITKFVAFCVSRMLEQHPEIRTTIKHFIQNTDL